MKLFVCGSRTITNNDWIFMVAFWNGISTGTQHDIEMAEKYGKPYKVLMEE